MKVMYLQLLILTGATATLATQTQDANSFKEELLTPINPNCTQNMVELLLLRHDIHLADMEQSLRKITDVLQLLTEIRDQFVLVSQPQASTGLQCELPFTLVAGQCVLFAKDEKLSWAAARQYCIGKGAHLAVFQDANTFAALIHYANIVNNVNADIDIWVGGSDEAVEGVWTWVTGDLMPQGAPFWGSVNNYVSDPATADRAQNCAGLYHRDNYYMHDFSCSSMKAPLCQRATSQLV